MSTNEGTVNKVQEGDAVCSLRIGQMYQGLSRYCHFLAQNPWDGGFPFLYLEGFGKSCFRECYMMCEPKRFFS